MCVFFLDTVDVTILAALLRYKSDNQSKVRKAVEYCAVLPDIVPFDPA
jgi:hypothetical protein